MSRDEATAAKRRVGCHNGKLFTVEQANRALVLVRKIVADIVEQYARLLDLRTRRQELAAGTRDHARVQRLQQQLEVILAELNHLHDELTDIGCVLKDWGGGLVDFPASYQGRSVWLCWRLGEPTVTHWHELHSGFAGRQPIGPDFG